MRTDYAYYEVRRSRNNGKSWSNLTHGHELGWDEANRFMDKEIEKHPSDWLKLIKVQATSIRDYTGNKKKSNKKEPLINGMPVDKYLRTLCQCENSKRESTLVFK